MDDKSISQRISLVHTLIQIIEALQKSIITELNTKIPLKFVFTSAPSQGAGVGILLYAQTSEGHRIASSTMIEIPERLTPAKISKQEVKVRERGKSMVNWLTKQISHGGVVDEYLADQIVIFMALASLNTGERSEVLVGQISLHTETAMRIAETMLRNIIFSVEKLDRGYLMICDRL
jgi:RNA 3'-terminal phosphate cyclase